MTKCTDAAEDFMTALPHDNDLNQGLFETPCARNNLKFLVQKLLQSFITLAYHNWANDFFFIGNQSYDNTQQTSAINTVLFYQLTK